MRRIKWRSIVWLIACVALSLTVVGCGKDKDANEEQPEDGIGQGLEAPEPLDTSSQEVIATYEGLTSGEVTEGEFNRSLNIMSVVNPQVAMLLEQPEFKDQLLTQYITQKSISSEMETTEEIETQVDEWIDMIREQYEQFQAEDEEADFAAYLEENGFTEDDLRQFFEESMKVEEHFRSQITDEELEASYSRLKKEKDLRLYSAKIHHILIEINEERDDEAAKKQAEEIKKKLDQGANFAELAQEYSDDPGSKESGGLLGEEMVQLASDTGPGLDPSFAEAARDIPLNEISDPVRSQFGYHLIKVEEREQLNLEKAKAIVQNEVLGEKYQNYVDHDLKIDTKKS